MTTFVPGVHRFAVERGPLPSPPRNWRLGVNSNRLRHLRPPRVRLSFQPPQVGRGHRQAAVVEEAADVLSVGLAPRGWRQYISMPYGSALFEVSLV